MTESGEIAISGLKIPKEYIGLIVFGLLTASNLNLLRTGITLNNIINFLNSKQKDTAYFILRNNISIWSPFKRTPGIIGLIIDTTCEIFFHLCWAVAIALSLKRIIESTGFVKTIGLILFIILLLVGILRYFADRTHSIKEIYIDNPPWISTVLDIIRTGSLLLAFLYAIGLI